MKLIDDNGFSAEVKVIHNGADETKDFIAEQSKFWHTEGDVIKVDNGVNCILKMMSFINRLHEFKDIPTNEEDLIIINGKSFRYPKKYD